MTKSSTNTEGKLADNIVSLVDDILKNAWKAGASDIHFDPTRSSLLIKLRLDGQLSTVETLPRLLAENVIARLKVLAGLLTYRNDIPQEGTIIARSGTENLIDQRLSIFPTIYGQRAVLRLFYAHKELTDLNQLGFAKETLDCIKDIASQSQGLLILTGPAGSGKSTTLAAVLRHITKTFPGKSIVTLEDPVEIKIDNVTQVQITPHGRMTFPTALRSLLRQDPQVLMIGEIRDAQTAKIAVEAALTGHFLMTTMHSGTPAQAIIRLLEMGIEPYQLTSSVSAILNQRLVRKLCQNCKNAADSKSPQPAGCEKCFHTGYAGRALAAELVELDSTLRKAILEKTDIEQLQAIITKKGHSDLAADARRLIELNTTTPQEVKSICQKR